MLAVSSVWHRPDDHLFVGRKVGVDLYAVGHELLELRHGVVPPHLAGLLDQQPAFLGNLLLQHAALVGMHEVGGEVADAVVFLLERLREFRGGLLLRQPWRGDQPPEQDPGEDAHVHVNTLARPLARARRQAHPRLVFGGQLFSAPGSGVACFGASFVSTGRFAASHSTMPPFRATARTPLRMKPRRPRGNWQAHWDRSRRPRRRTQAESAAAVRRCITRSAPGSFSELCS